MGYPFFCGGEFEVMMRQAVLSTANRIITPIFVIK
jgi:hypothetical protein